MLRRLYRWQCAPTIAADTFVVMMALAGRWSARLERRCLPFVTSEFGKPGRFASLLSKLHIMHHCNVK